MAAEKLEKSLALTMRLLRRIKGHGVTMVAALGAMILAAFAEIAPIGLAKAAIDVLFPAAGNEGSALQVWCAEAGRALAESFGYGLEEVRPAALAFITVALILLGLVSAVATYANTYFGRYLSALIVVDLRCSLMDRILELPVAFYTRRKVGDLVSRFSTDVQITYNAVRIFLLILVLQPLIFLMALLVAFSLNWRLTLVTLVVGPLIVFPLAMIGKKVRRRSRQSLVSLGESMEAINQALSGLRVIKAFRAEELESQRYREVNRRWLRRQSSLIRAKAAGRGIMDVVYGITLALIMGAGGWLTIEGRWGLDASTFMSFLIAMATAYRPLRRISIAYNDWQESMAATARVFEIIDRDVASPDAPGAVAIGPIRQSIVFDDVSFSYTDDDGTCVPVLHDLSFEIPSGQTVALVGPSGAGKSTIADLLFRFHEPSQGRIIFDGQPASQITRASLLGQMAVVSQRPFLFNTTILENIAYGRPDASREEIEAAAKAAHIHDLILGLPDGYDTLVGERGASLSGGQLQRVTIARAILKDASFLILDEATSSLDTESERAVQDALRNLLKGRTALVIAHRLSTIVDADKIIVIEDGRLIEEGRHQNLLEAGGLYARLYQSQHADNS